MSTVRLHIDRLVLHGVAPEEAASVVAALKTELGRSLVSGELPTQATATPVLRGQLPAGAQGAALGRAAGKKIAGGIAR